MKKSGFTLVELLATLIILSLVIVIVATKGFGLLDNTKKEITKLDEKSIVEATKLLGNDIINCDDDIDNELIGKLNDYNITDVDECSDISFDNSCLDIPFSFLKSEGYITGNNIGKYNDDYHIFLCNIDNKFQTLLSPYRQDMAANIILKETLFNNDTKYREDPLTKPGKESTIKSLKGADPTSFPSKNTRPTNYYIAYADDYIIDEKTGKISLVNPTIPENKFTVDMANDLVGKYTVWKTSNLTIEYTQNKDKIFKITTDVENITSNAVYYATINNDSIITTSIESTLSYTNDDYGKSYYYRGDVTNNYINFASMCWRIVRIEGDGSIKIVLEDKNYECDNPSFEGNWVTDSNVSYGFDGNHESCNYTVANFLGNNTYNLSNSLSNFQVSLLEKIQTTYLNNELELNDYLKVEEWCYDDTKYDEQSLDNDCRMDIAYSYGAYKRIGKPSLKCTGKKLTKYNNNIDMYVGALTADETAFAGATTRKNLQYYLMNDYITDKKYSWLTLSPSMKDFDESYDNVFIISKVGSLDSFQVDDWSNTLGVRPSITLKSSIDLTGTGTLDDPYIVN